MNESQSEDELDWDFYFYVANTMLGWSVEEFLNFTPAHWLKQFVMYLRMNNPDSLKKEQEIHYLDNTPFI